ncbi:glycosyltransferase [Sulfitobacter sp. HNIBRBA3233]|uniref:glycosyltransferase n=1 Tax=Sulfitobacter marinivivus TaxID=3158558 RepID=UPI0032DED081
MKQPPLPQRVVYVVSHSLPYSSNGYAVRSHAVATALSELGHEVVVINRPGRPWSIEGFDPARTIPTDQRIDGVRYLFLPLGAAPEDGQRARLRAAENVLAETFDILRPGCVIAASNWENAEPAQNAARRYGCAFFYEQRGFWDMARGETDSALSEADAVAAKRSRDYETRIARDARAAFTLGTAMKEEMVRRGVPAERIHLMPNGVSDPRPGGAPLSRADLGITARHLLGYIGSLSSYEGLELLVEATARLRGEGVDAALLVVGSDTPKGLVDADAASPRARALADLAATRGIAAHVHLVPQQPQSRIGSYTRLLDAFVMPRRRSDMTQIVPPIKPYSAASYGVPVLMTDMPPLDEVAQDIGAALFAEGDAAALATALRATFEREASGAAELRPGLRWTHRVRPLSRLLQGEAQALASAAAQGVTGHQTRPQHAGFDITRLPQVALGQQRGTLAYLGPETAPTDPRYDATRRVQLTRSNILAELATRAPGVFLVDWPALRATGNPDWDGLWSIDDMRLNRLMMTATRIATERGWQCHVAGPIQRSAAPLFRTVSQVFEEIVP